MDVRGIGALCFDNCAQITHYSTMSAESARGMEGGLGFGCFPEFLRSGDARKLRDLALSPVPR